MSENEEITENHEIELEKKSKFGLILYSFTAEAEGELNCNLGDVVEILHEGEDGWTEVKLCEKVGIIPTSIFFFF
jgi:hypothetical protein